MNKKQTLISRSGPSDGQPHCQTWGTLIGYRSQAARSKGAKRVKRASHLDISYLFLFPLLYMLLVEIDVRVLGTDVMHRILG